MSKHIDTAAADRIFELIQDMHAAAASKSLARGDIAGAEAVADNFDALLVKFGVK